MHIRAGELGFLSSDIQRVAGASTNLDGLRRSSQREILSQNISS